MTKIGYLFNKIALDTVDFYNNEQYQGDSYVPFMGFMVFVVGLFLLIVGVATYMTAKHNFSIFYDQRDSLVTHMDGESDEEEFKRAQKKLERDKKVGIGLMIAAAVCILASFIIL